MNIWPSQAFQNRANRMRHAASELASALEHLKELSGVDNLQREIETTKLTLERQVAFLDSEAKAAREREQSNAEIEMLQEPTFVLCSGCMVATETLLKREAFVSPYHFFDDGNCRRCNRHSLHLVIYKKKDTTHA